jgi:flavin-dependent dehydrogenase
LKQNEIDEPIDLLNSKWQGTNLLTRQRAKISGRRLFVIGDACGYAEPFTGEGMYWALRSGMDVSPLALEGIDKWIPELEERWTKMQARTKIYKMRCRILTLALRNESFRAGLIKVSSVAPNMVDRIAQFIVGANEIRSARSLT